MEFKRELIKEIKKYPDIYNEIRAEIVIPRFNDLKDQALTYMMDPKQDNVLERVDDLELIASIINNLNYYIEYEKELGESGL